MSTPDTWGNQSGEKHGGRRRREQGESAVLGRERAGRALPRWQPKQRLAAKEGGDDVASKSEQAPTLVGIRPGSCPLSYSATFDSESAGLNLSPSPQNCFLYVH